METPLPADAPEPQSEFWRYITKLLQEHHIVVDRPKGASHPRYPDVVYPLDYGYLQGTTAMDGGGVDVWIGSVPERALAGVLLTVDLKKKDTELKLLVGCTSEEIRQIIQFSNHHSMRALFVAAVRDPAALLRARQSIRRFTNQEIPKTVIDEVLELATLAPSAHNRQPWRFVVLQTAASKERLALDMGASFEADLIADGLSEAEVAQQVQRSRARIQQAPVVIVLCLDVNAGDRYPDPQRQRAEWVMGTQSLAMAGQNLLLAAQAKGLGAVWMCAPLFAQPTVQRALDLPAHWEPQGMALLGYPAKIPNRRARLPLFQVTRYL
ncbi:MAG TPA: nitroreductase family protein [Anaerolineales bacterium]|nr:nitroreductase family protein [Anaerolineales bacterium]